MGLFGRDKSAMVDPADALPGRTETMPVAAAHTLLGNPLVGPFPDGVETLVVGIGCFWGAERKFWEAPGIYSTAVGYSAGFTPNPSYEEVCSGLTGHNEVVLVAFDTAQTTLADVLRVFWESHNPTQGMRQGNDMGTQYRSGIYYSSAEQHEAAKSSLDMFQEAISAQGYGDITTEILPVGQFFYAEDYHQQYLYKNPNGYCGLGGTGVSCPIGLT